MSNLGSNYIKLEDKLEEGLNIIGHMRKIADLKEQERLYFYMKCPLWKAVRDNVSYKDDLVKHPDETLIMSYRGTGRSVRLHNVHLYSKNYEKKPPEEANVFCMEVQVEYVNEEDSYQDHPPTFVRTYRLNPPTDLAVNFSQDEFDAWVAQMREERLADEKTEDMKQLKRLTEKYPHETQQMIGGT